MKVVVDALGGDNAPQVVLDGLAQALASEPQLEVLLTGPDDVVKGAARAYPQRVTAVATSEFISMQEHPAEAVRQKKDSSIVVGCRLVAEGQADGFYSAGSTGAVMTAATLVMGRIRGISRPVLVTMLPTASGYVVFGDVGANADCKPEYLLQFALMQQAYATNVLKIAKPRIGLLNIGEENTKGSELAQQSFQLLQDNLENFVGNAEGHDISSGRFDCIVTDGFTGNVVLKTIEGTAALLLNEFKAVLTANTVSKLAASVVKPGLKNLSKRLSSDEVGGAPLLGVRGSCFIGHGSASALSICNGILATARAIQSDLVATITQSVAN